MNTFKSPEAQRGDAPPTNAALGITREPGKDILAGVPNSAELANAVAYATDAVDIAQQGRKALLAAQTWEEIEKDREVEATLRAKARDQRRATGLDQLAARKVQDDAETDAIINAAKADAELANADVQDRLDARRALGTVKRLTDSAAYLAAQYRQRKIAIRLALFPAVVGVLLGAVNVQAGMVAVSAMFGAALAAADPMWWVLFALEPLATVPLIGILVVQLGAVLDAGDTLSVATMRRSKFWPVMVTLFAVSVAINVGPHLLLGEWYGLVWLWVPASIVIGLHLVPIFNAIYADRILRAKTDVEQSTPFGKLTEADVRTGRYIALLRKAVANGTVRGELRDGIPTAKAAARTIRDQLGTCSVDHATRAVNLMRLMDGLTDATGPIPTFRPDHTSSDDM